MITFFYIKNQFQKPLTTTIYKEPLILSYLQILPYYDIMFSLCLIQKITIGGLHMGVFSKYHRYHEAGEQANVNNVGKHGFPAYSLFTTKKVFTLHHHIDITDANENILYTSESNFPSLHDKTSIFDSTGNQIAYMERKLLSLHERRFVTMSDGISFELSNELFHLVKDITNINGLNWQLRGNIAALNFELYDNAGNIVAVIGQKMLSIHDKYCVDIYRPEYEKIIVAILIALQHMIADRQSSGGSSGGGSSSS